MKLVQLLLGSLITILGGSMAGLGARKAMQIPTLAVRRMLILALGALAGFVIAVAGIIFVLKGVSELATMYQEPWIFSFVTGGFVILIGGAILFASLRRDAWIGESEPAKSELPPILNALTKVALDLMQERRDRPAAHPGHASQSPSAPASTSAVSAEPSLAGTTIVTTATSPNQSRVSHPTNTPYKASSQVNIHSIS